MMKTCVDTKERDGRYLENRTTIALATWLFWSKIISSKVMEANLKAVQNIRIVAYFIDANLKEAQRDSIIGGLNRAIILWKPNKSLFDGSPSVGIHGLKILFTV